MVKKGLNLNICNEFDLESIGISKENAKKIVEVRRLKEEFVNPGEVKEIIGKEEFEKIVSNYNLYTTSKYVWERRITNSKYSLYEPILELHFLNDSILLFFKSLKGLFL